MMKAQFLTQDSARINLISHRIKGFLSSIFFQQNLTFKHSYDAEMSLEVKGSKRFKDRGA